MKMTRGEAAEYKGVHKITITNWIKKGLLPYVKKGRRKMIKKKHLDQIIPGCGPRKPVRIEDNEFEQEENDNKLLVNDRHCKGCWALRGKVCMFRRCIRHHGFTADKEDDE